MTNRILLVICSALMMGASCRKKQPETTPNVVEPIEVAEPDVELRVLSMTPDEIEAGATPNARVSGSGFEKGLIATLGETGLVGIQIDSTEQFSFVIPSLAEGAYDLRVQNLDGVSHTLRSALLVTPSQPTVPEDCLQFTVYFGVDQSVLTSQLKEELGAKSHCFKPEFNFRVEGHCDDRGTTEYNMALGVRRAQTVQEFIVSLGISTEKIETISYGEERPEESGSGENAWAKNRRAVIAVSE